jgi:hypothetical protein
LRLAEAEMFRMGNSYPCTAVVAGRVN